MSRTRHRLGKVLLLASALTACGGSGPTGPGRLPEGLPADHPALEGVGGPAPAPAPDTVLAEVNGHAITSADLDVALAAMPGEDRLEYTTPEMLTELVESLVDRHLQAEAAKAAGLPAEDWLVRELGRVPAPTPDEIAVHYAAHRDEFRVPARVLVTRVRVASRDGAERARVDLEAGVPFSGLLARTEETGLAVDQVWLQAGTAPGPVGSIALALGPGEVSEVLDVPAGYAVVRAESREPGAERPLAEVSDGIRASLADARRQAAWAGVRDGLRKDARIVLNTAAIAAHAPPADPAP